MRLLLDTCTILYAVATPELLSKPGRDLLEAHATETFYSPMSCAEIACLAERGRIALDRHWKSWFNHFIPMNDWKALDVNLRIVQEAYSLPGEFHSDPVDRILVATARIHGLHIVTPDKKLQAYPHVDTLW